VEVILHAGSYPPNDHGLNCQNTPVAQDYMPIPLVLMGFSFHDNFSQPSANHHFSTDMSSLDHKSLHSGKCSKLW